MLYQLRLAQHDAVAPQQRRRARLQRVRTVLQAARHQPVRMKLQVAAVASHFYRRNFYFVRFKYLSPKFYFLFSQASSNEKRWHPDAETQTEEIWQRNEAITGWQQER